MKLWARHLLAFVLPLATLAFAASGPHRWWVALAWLGIIPVILAVDRFAGPAARGPAPDAMPRLPFGLLLWLLAAVQIATVVLLCRMAAAGGFSVDLLVAGYLVGNNSGWGAIVVAHELIHRPGRVERLAGRLLLVTVLYEHFYTEHLRGHHARVGTAADPATARFGERWRPFLWRSITGQLRSAWRLETRRLGDEHMRPWDPRLLRSRVVHGFLVEAAFLIAIAVAFGPAALAVFVWQAFTAVGLLESVNYFEHWGLAREARVVRPVDSWDSESWFTLYSLVGLARHADHHADAARPYPLLRHHDESPKLPTGYYGMVALAQLSNARFRRLMTEELRARGLGPFAGARAPEPQPDSRPVATGHEVGQASV